MQKYAKIVFSLIDAVLLFHTTSLDKHVDYD